MKIKAKFKENNNVIPANFGEVIVIKPDGPAFVDTSDATATELSILEGDTAYVNGKRLTGTIPKIQGAEITPSAQDAVAVNKGVYTEGDIVVKGDKNLSPENIVEGKEIYGVKGSHVNKGVLELLYTEGAEITPEMWGTDELEFSANIMMKGTKCKKVVFPSNLKQCIGLPENTSLEVIDAPMAEGLTEGNFIKCSNLAFAFFPSVINSGRRPFTSSGKKEGKLILPNLSLACQWLFNHSAVGCNFSLIDLGVCGALQTQAFGNCPNLEALVLRKTDAICANSTPFTAYPNTTVITYVPPLTDTGENMVALYQAATNWTVVADRIKPFYIAETVDDIATLLANDSIAEGDMIICDVNHSYTIKGGKTF